MLSSNQPINHHNSNHRTPPSTSSSSFFRRTMRSSDHYGEDSHDSASDQDELVGSTDMDDDDLSDTEEIQFTYCNNSSSAHLHPADEDNELCPGPSDCCCASSNAATSQSLNNPETADAPCELHTTLQLRVKLCSWASAVAVSSLGLLVWFPLYLHQLSATSVSLGGRPLNAYGALLFIGLLVTVGFFGAFLVMASVRKWKAVRVMEVPLPWTR